MSMMNLPEENQVNIFLRLPANSILACRCVCKPLRVLLSTPEFIKSHLNNRSIQNSNPRLMVDHFLHEESPRNSTLHSIDYESVSSLSLTSTRQLVFDCGRAAVMNFPFEAEASLAWTKKRKKMETIVVDIWGSCDGLICLGIRMSPDTKKEEDIVCIWNPATGEYKKISSPICDGCHSVRYGFGYDNSIDDYQLVSVMDYEYAGSLNIEVYTLGSDSWSTIRTPVHYSFPVDVTHGLLCKGALHWVGTTTDQKPSAEVILSFDISSKRLLHLSFPERSPVRTIGNPVHKNVAVLGDRLCIAFIQCSKVDLWIMQDYGVTESWTKQFTSTQLSMTRRLLCKPIWCLESGEILIQTDKDLVSYDQKNNKTRSVRICDVTMGSNLETYVESIVSLKSGTYAEMPKSRRTMMKDATRSKKKTMTGHATRH